jgi:hypothetical protein
MNEALLSGREQRMQKTYSGLFKLQNLLETTVRNVQVSKNLSLSAVRNRHQACTRKRM